MYPSGATAGQVPARPSPASPCALPPTGCRTTGAVHTRHFASVRAVQRYVRCWDAGSTGRRSQSDAPGLKPTFLSDPICASEGVSSVRSHAPLNFYSGKVEPLGVSAIGAAINSNNGEELNAITLESLLNKIPRDVHDHYVYRVRCLVAGVVMTAKKKDGRNWQVDAIQNSDYERKFIGQLSPQRMRPLIVFIGGGGSRSAWYCSTISSTYKEFRHHSAGIPPYKMVNVPSPKDFRMGVSDEGDFTRFAISYGLSIPFGEGPEIRLPSQFADAEKPPQWVPPGGINYADSKDVYE
jgi:hypothetical protein